MLRDITKRYVTLNVWVTKRSPGKKARKKVRKKVDVSSDDLGWVRGWKCLSFAPKSRFSSRLILLSWQISCFFRSWYQCAQSVLDSGAWHAKLNAVPLINKLPSILFCNHSDHYFPSILTNIFSYCLEPPGFCHYRRPLLVSLLVPDCPFIDLEMHHFNISASLSSSTWSACGNAFQCSCDLIMVIGSVLCPRHPPFANIVDG